MYRCISPPDKSSFSVLCFLNFVRKIWNATKKIDTIWWVTGDMGGSHFFVGRREKKHNFFQIHAFSMLFLVKTITPRRWFVSVCYLSNFRWVSLLGCDAFIQWLLFSPLPFEINFNSSQLDLIHLRLCTKFKICFPNAQIKELKDTVLPQFEFGFQKTNTIDCICLCDGLYRCSHTIRFENTHVEKLSLIHISEPTRPY